MTAISRWRGLVRRRGAVWWVPLLVAFAGQAARLSAQATTEDNLRVVALTFRGASGVSETDLRAGIVTEAQRCKSVFLMPFCWVSNSGRVEHRPRLNRQELARDELRLRVLYWKRGYRQAQVSAAVEPRGDGVAVRFDVVEGEPTIIASIDVEQTREILRQGQIRRADLPDATQPLDLERLDSAGARLRRMLWDRGYADAQVQDTADVDGAARSARVDVIIDPRRRTVIDTVEVAGNEVVSTRTLLRLLDLRSGQPFRRSDLLEAQRRLYRSELFRQALMEVPETEDSAKLVRVTVREAPMQAVRAGGGYSTIDFVQTEVRYTRYNWMGAARRLELRGIVGNLFAPQLYGKSLLGGAVPEGVSDDVDDVFLRPTWQLSAEVTQPRLFSRRNSIGLTVFANRRSVPGIVVDEGGGASVSVTRRLSEHAPASLTYRFERTRVEAGDLYFCVNFTVCTGEMIDALRGSQSLSPLWLTAYADLADDAIEPSRGWTLRLDAEHASALTVSDFRYNRITARVAHYTRVGPGVLAGQVRFGWVRGSASTAGAVGEPAATSVLLHPRKRFYAGGARSVRGFAENQLGPRILTIDPARLLAPTDTTTGTACTAENIATGECDPNVASSDDFQPRPLGGNSLTEASVEYRLPLTQNITAALFVDGARLDDRQLDPMSTARSAITPGFGVRYRSPIGPVRIDMGIRPRLAEDLPVITQIADESGTLQLVRLSTVKHYDPLENSGGFLGGVFSRLQLHLSIGEAF